MEFELVNIDLQNPPEWFLKISPMRKVPVLLVDDDVIFESAIINEFIDEVTLPQLHPADPLEKAKHRAWIEFASQLIVTQYKLSIAQTQTDFEQYQAQLISELNQLEHYLSKSPFFNGAQFCLADAAFAPFFIRQTLLNNKLNLDIFPEKINHWSEHLLQHKSVQSSVISDFENKYLGYLKKASPYIDSLLTGK